MALFVFLWLFLEVYKASGSAGDLHNDVTCLQQPEFFTFSKVSLKSNHSFTGHQLHLSQLLLEIVKKKGVCRLSVLVPSHFLQQALGPIPHSEDVCQSTREKKAKIN